MFTYMTGDVVKAYVDGDVDYFIHQANCFNTMSAGVALSVRKQLPALYEVDQDTIRGDRRKLGGYTYIHRAYNLYGQYKYSRRFRCTNYECVYEGLKLIRDHILNENWIKGRDNVKVGMPKIGCSLAGGSWTIVSAIITDVFENTPITVCIYEL